MMSRQRCRLCLQRAGQMNLRRMKTKRRSLRQRALQHLRLGRKNARSRGSYSPRQRIVVHHLKSQAVLRRSPASLRGSRSDSPGGSREIGSGMNLSQCLDERSLLEHSALCTRPHAKTFTTTFQLPPPKFQPSTQPQCPSLTSQRQSRRRAPLWLRRHASPSRSGRDEGAHCADAF
jgi:hypothetical protein